MSDTGWVSPGTTSNDTSIGTESWTDTNNAKTSDDNYATVYLDNLVAVISDYSVKLVKGGTIGGNNKATDTELTTTDNTITYGGSSDLWGLTLSYSDVNSTNFGVVYSATEDESNVISNYLKCTNFGFSIPTDATINGIEVNIEQSVAGDYCDTQVDCVQIKVYYTEIESSERDLYIQGTSTSSSERDLYTIGSLPSFSERDLYTLGISGGNSERDIYSAGIDTSDSERGIYSIGYYTDSSEKNVYSVGELGGNSTRSLYTDGILDGTALYKNLSLNLDNSAVRNRVYVRGGTYLSDTTTIKQVADGQQTVFYLPEKPHEITVAEGATSKTVGIKNIDSYTDYDYLVNYQEKYVETDTAPASSTVMTFTFKYDIPVLVAVEDNDSIEKYGQLEYIIFDKDIDTVDQARDRASAELTDYAETITSGTFETETSGWVAGQYLTVDLPDLDIDETFVVKQVVTRSIGGGNFTYFITIVSAEMLGIIHFLIGLLETDKNFLDISSDEVVDEIKTVTGETFELTAGTPSIDLSTDVFKYDSNADWDVAEWQT